MHERGAAHRYVCDERRPLEVLVFEVAPDDVEHFLRVDHEVWTLGEAQVDGFDRSPFLSKEVWLDDHRPGEITIVFVWESMAHWQQVGAEEIQQQLERSFAERFGRPYRLIGAWHQERAFGLHRVSRFERIDDIGPVEHVGHTAHG